MKTSTPWCQLKYLRDKTHGVVKLSGRSLPHHSQGDKWKRSCLECYHFNRSRFDRRKHLTKFTTGKLIQWRGKPGKLSSGNNALGFFPPLLKAVKIQYRIYIESSEVLNKHFSETMQIFAEFKGTVKKPIISHIYSCQCYRVYHGTECIQGPQPFMLLYVWKRNKPYKDCGMAKFSFLKKLALKSAVNTKSFN